MWRKLSAKLCGLLTQNVLNRKIYRRTKYTVDCLGQDIGDSGWWQRAKAEE